MTRSSQSAQTASRSNALPPRALVLLFFFALALRVIYVCFAVDNTTIGTWLDAGPDISLHLLHGHGYIMSWDIAQDFRSFRTPGWPLTLYALWKVFGYSLLIPKLFLAFLSALTCVLIAVLGAHLYDERVGRWAGFLMAICTTLIRWTGTLGMETLAVFTLVLGVTLVCVPQSRLSTNWRYVAAGSVLGWLCLTRPIWMVYVALLIVALWLLQRQQRTQTALLGLSVALVVAPWVARNAVVHRAFLLASTDGGLAFMEANNPVSFRHQGSWIPGYAASLPEVQRRLSQLSEVEFNSWMMQKGVGYVRAEPLAFARIYLLRLGYLWRPSPPIQQTLDLGRKHLLWLAAYWSICFVLLAVALILLRPWKDNRQWPLLLVLIWGSFSIPLFSSQLRYRAPIEPAILLYAAAGGVALADKFKFSIRRNVASTDSQQAP